MRLSLRARQVSVVTALAVVSTVVLAGFYLSTLLTVGLDEDRARGELLARALFHRAREVVADAEDLHRALRDDPGLRAILESSIAYTENVTYAAIVDTDGVTIAHSSPQLEGELHVDAASLVELLDEDAVGQLRAVYRDSTLEIEEPMLLGETPFGSIRVGLSTVLIRNSLDGVLQPALITVLATVAAGVLLSLLLAQWALKPIHVITAGLDQLGQGQSEVQLALPASADFTSVGKSFQAISDRLAAQAPRNAAQLQSVVEHLEDAVAILDPGGHLLFANAAMNATLPESRTTTCFVDESLPSGHPYRRLVAEAMHTKASAGPAKDLVPTTSGDDESPAECEVTANAFHDAQGEFEGVILVSRRALGWVRSVESTIETSRQLAQLGQLLAGVAHEVKNPLNAMTIHLELLRQKLGGSDPRLAEVPSPRGTVFGLRHGSEGDESETSTMATTVSETTIPIPSRDLLQHVTIVGNEIRRLDDVIQGFLRFIKPDDLVREPVDVGELVEGVVALMKPEADRVDVTLDYRPPTPTAIVMGDRAMLRQALLNVALNAVQAMPDGGRLRLAVGEKTQWVQVDVEDQGPGMAPDVLQHAFQLYYTTKKNGSGIGLSMVFRIVQLHGGTIDVESTAGSGTRVQLKLPQGGHPALKTAWEAA